MLNLRKKANLLRYILGASNTFWRELSTWGTCARKSGMYNE